MQTILEPVLVPDHDFPIRFLQKLILSVYLLINSKETNELLCNDEIKPLWVLLVDSGPNENLQHFKNIVQYSYNPVEKSISSLFKKVAGITLPIDHFGNHLDSQRNVQNYELGLQNFHYTKQALADFENDDENNDDLFVSWSWIENYCNMYQYSLDIQKYNNLSYCSPKRADEAAALLSASNGFLPPLIKGKNGYYLNTIHTLEYFDSIKIPSYDTYFPSFFLENYVRH
ncbi:35696_t:CDS:2 [Gigaspora margarita]|uniref:35696_t:CDS:1 n=1 Tax=Gigaspora margarita TaxID=4874 RepID=A0ABN7V8G9_GIGMA|nr:35696_t:CDS:2 [Gigaspora margarita]